MPNIRDHLQEMKVTIAEDGMPVHKIKGSPTKVKKGVLSFFNAKYR